MTYEATRRKIQEIREILARTLPAGKWTRPPVPGYVGRNGARLRVVGSRGILSG